MFSGFDPKTRQYDLDPGGWGYKTEGEGIPQSIEVETDQTLQHPRCIFQILKRHFSRYTPEMASQICGCPPEEIIRVAELLCRNSGRERTSAMVYALGWTQHSTGVQMIRAAGIIQLLLGNVGRPGGGIMAMRGHCSIQGSTDIPTLYDLLPGYIPHPSGVPEHATLKDYLKHGRGWAASHAAKSAGFWEGEVLEGYWANLPALFTSLLKAWYGDAATAENEFGYQWIPKNESDHSQLATFDKMSRGEVHGLFFDRSNPAAGAPNGKLNRTALAQLDWMVVRDWFEHESANFWYADPAVDDPGKIKTEVFFLPAASIPEKVPLAIEHRVRQARRRDRIVRGGIGAGVVAVAAAAAVGVASAVPLPRWPVTPPGPPGRARPMPAHRLPRPGPLRPAATGEAGRRPGRRAAAGRRRHTVRPPRRRIDRMDRSLCEGGQL